MELVSWAVLTVGVFLWLIFKMIPGYAHVHKVGMDSMPHYGGYQAAAKDRSRYGYTSRKEYLR